MFFYFFFCNPPNLQWNCVKCVLFVLLIPIVFTFQQYIMLTSNVLFLPGLRDGQLCTAVYMLHITTRAYTQHTKHSIKMSNLNSKKDLNKWHSIYYRRLRKQFSIFAMCCIFIFVCGFVCVCVWRVCMDVCVKQVLFTHRCMNSFSVYLDGVGVPQQKEPILAPFTLVCIVCTLRGSISYKIKQTLCDVHLCAVYK